MLGRVDRHLELVHAPQAEARDQAFVMLFDVTPQPYEVHVVERREVAVAGVGEQLGEGHAERDQRGLQVDELQFAPGRSDEVGISVRVRR